VSVDATNDAKQSKSITLSSSATRNKWVNIRVKAVGQKNSSDWVELEKVCLINSLPGKPGVSPTSATLPSSGGTVTLTLTPGSDTNTSQSKHFKYKIGSGDYQTLTSTTLAATKEGTYTFKSYDGLETGTDTVTVTIDKNTKPTLTISASGSTNSAYTITATTNKTSGTLTYGIKYNSTDY
jgi:hypothetical protein